MGRAYIVRDANKLARIGTGAPESRALRIMYARPPAAASRHTHGYAAPVARATQTILRQLPPTLKSMLYWITPYAPMLPGAAATSVRAILQSVCTHGER